jgi:hypothetical protein
MMFIVVLKLKIEHSVLGMACKCQNLLTLCFLPYHVFVQYIHSFLYLYSNIIVLEEIKTQESLHNNF